MTDENRLSNLYGIIRETDIGAEGHYARVYEAHCKVEGKPVAFKLMRHDYLSPTTQANGEVRNHDREWQAFRTEVRALKLFSNHEMVTEFIDCGFINTSVDDDPDFPEEHDLILSLKTDIDKFLEVFDDYRRKGWRPYIVTEYVDRRNATVFIISPEDRIGRKFPTYVVLEVISQFVDLLVHVQEKGFIYGDHKLAHTYWIFQDGHLKVIDWNGGRFFDDETEFTPAQLRQEDVRDLVLKVMYSLLTGERPVEKGVRPDGGWTGHMTKIELPKDIAGHDILQEFFNRACDWEFQDARHLRSVLDKLMADYGIEREPSNIPLSENVKGRAEVLALLKRIDDVLVELQLIRDATFENIDTKYPPHIREEFQSIYISISRLLETNDLFTKTDLLG